MKEALVHTPDGIRDIYGDEMIRKSIILDAIHDVFHSYNFRDIETPTFEYFNIFNKSIGSAPSNTMYKFFDRNNNTLVLRPDFTPSVARCVTKYFEKEDLPIRLCYIGNAFKNVPLHQGKSNEIKEAGCELINDDTSGGEAEILSLVIDSMKAAGLTDFKIEIGEVQYFKGLVEEAGLSKEEEYKLREYIEMRNFFGLTEYAESLDIPENVKSAFMDFSKLFGGVEILDKASEFTSNVKSMEAIERLRKVLKALSYYGYEDYIGFDLGMLNGYEYYTGIIFRAYTYGTGDAIVKGGRYNTLLSEFGKDAPAIGFTLFIDELFLALSTQKKLPEVSPKGVLCLYMSDAQEKAVKFASFARNNGYPVSVIRKSSRHDINEYQEYIDNFRIESLVFFDRDEVYLYKDSMKKISIDELQNIFAGGVQ